MPTSISPRDLAARMAAGEQFHLLDVREEEEYGFCRIEPSQLIPIRQLAGCLNDISTPPGAQLVVYCHHGVRSLKAAEFLEQSGIAPVMSLTGGIEAWSLEVDPNIRRY